MVNETPQQNKAAEFAVLRANCGPSLKQLFLNCLDASGFRTQTDALLTLTRDFIAGKIKYKDGILQSQEQNQSYSPDSQQGVSRAPESVKTNR